MKVNGRLDVKIRNMLISIKWTTHDNLTFLKIFKVLGILVYFEKKKGVTVKLLVISDLHFEEINNWDTIDSITEKMLKKACDKIGEYEEILVMVLGDIIDCGGCGDLNKKYSQADIYFEKLKKEYENLSLLFVPGNHDLSNEPFKLSKFNEFIKRHSFKNTIQFSDECSVFSLEIGGVNLILVDSTLTRDYKKAGEIDVEKIKNNLSQSKNLIFMHFPPCDIEGADRSVPESKELIATRTNFIFYGHQHGGVNITDFLEGDTDIHSVGALFLSETGCKNDFLLLDICGGEIQYAIRYNLIGNFFRQNFLFPIKEDVKSHNLRLEPPTRIKSTISRNLKLAHSADSDFKIESINSVLKKNNKLMLLGDAGIGKSFELAKIYKFYENDEDYFPLWLEGRKTNCETIKRYIKIIEENTLDCKIPVLIIDGLDEIEQDFISQIVRDLSAAVIGNFAVKVIVSARKNYQIRVSDFKEYDILPLDKNDIKTIAKKNGICNEKTFVENIEKSNYLSLAKVPFYLLGIIELYREGEKLPKYDQLLEKMIYYRLKKADEKFIVEKGKQLLRRESEVKLWLEELSFLMQSCHLIQIENELYTQNFNEDQREYLDRTGLLTFNENNLERKWFFEHNNFREYFAAKYICNIPFNELLDIITSDEKKDKLRPSWLNTVSFVLLLRKEEDLKTWLVKNAKDALVGFESDKLSEENRNEVFFSIMEDVSATDIPIYASVHDLEKLSRYCQSKETIDFLINIIQDTSCSYVSLWSGLKVLSHCTNFYGKKSDLKTLILGYINKNSLENTVRFGIETLVNIFADEPLEVLEIIYSSIEKDERSSVISIICELIFIANAADEYINYISEIFKIIGKYNASLDVMYRVEQCAKKIYEPKNIIRILKILSIREDSRYYYNTNRLFESLIYNLRAQVVEDKIFDEIVNIYYMVTEIFDTGKIKILNSYFEKTKTADKAFKLLLSLEIEDDKKLFIIEDIMCEEFVDILVESYKNEVVNSSLYKWYAQRLPERSSLFERLNLAAIEKEGYEISRRKSMNWEIINKKGEERYFNSLFDIDDYKLLTNDILELIPGDTKYGGDVFEKIPTDRFDLKLAWGGIKRWGGVDCSISDFIKNINWELFSIHEIFNSIRNNEQIIITPEQKEFIKKICDGKITKIEFDKLDEKNPMDKEALFYAKMVVYFIKRFDFSYEDEKFLEMLLLPWYFFATSSGNSESEVLKFISSRITDANKLKDKIIDNLQRRNLSNSAIPTHLSYCLENKLDNTNAVQLAKRIFISIVKELEYYKITAINYLLEIKGESYVDHLVGELDEMDVNLLDYLSSKLKTDNNCLVKKLIQANNKSTDNPIKYLGNLIRLNQKYGIEKYLELAKKENSIPDFPEDESMIPDVTNSISEISNINLLNHICDLLVLCKSNDFVDKDIWGLNRSLERAINNLIQVDAKKVKESLLLLNEKYPNEKKLIQTINWLIKETERVLNISGDIPWEIDCALVFLANHHPKRLYN